jgi:hypothetical protein
MGISARRALRAKRVCMRLPASIYASCALHTRPLTGSVRDKLLTYINVRYSRRPRVNRPPRGCKQGPTTQRQRLTQTMPATTITATLRDNRLFVQYRRRERVDANTTDTSTLARLPLDVISNALSYLPSRQLTNVVKNVNARYKELAMPLLTQRLFWLERELAHDMWELVSEYDYAGRRHYYQELARLCRTLNCRTYIEDPKTVLTS